METEQWKKQMEIEFLKWRKNNRKLGGITSSEVSQWTLEILNEANKNAIKVK